VNTAKCIHILSIKLLNNTVILFKFIFCNHATQHVDWQQCSQKISIIMEYSSWFHSSQHSYWKQSSKRHILQTAAGV